MRTLDFSLPGGWHATLFLPWGRVTMAIVLVVACGLLLKAGYLVRR
jgi:hypothetical protein